MYQPTASELGLSDEITGAPAFNNRHTVDAAEPIVEAVPASLSPYEILQEAFTENANGKDLLRIKVKRKSKRRVQVLTEEAKAISESFVEALCGPNLEGLDRESLLAEVDSYYHQLVDSGHNKTAAYRLKQSASFKIDNRIYLQGILAQQQVEAAGLPPEVPLAPIEAVELVDPAVGLIEPIDVIPTLDVALFEPVVEEPVVEEPVVEEPVVEEPVVEEPVVEEPVVEEPVVEEPVVEEPVVEEPVVEEPVVEEPVVEEPVVEPEMIVTPTRIPAPAQRQSRFGLGRAKEMARRAVNVALIGLGLLGLDRLAHANHDLPALDLPQPTPITRDVSVYTSSQDQARAEQRYFTQLARNGANATATPDSGAYPAAQTGSTNPEAPRLAEIQGNMKLAFKYPDGTEYTYKQTVGIEDVQDYSDVEQGENLASKTLNGLTIVNVEETAVVQAHQTWRNQEGPLADLSRRGNELGDANIQQLAGTKLRLNAEDGTKLHGTVTDVQLLNADEASPLYYQVRVVPGFDGYYVLTCHKQGLDGNTNQWMWITVQNDLKGGRQIPQ